MLKIKKGLNPSTAAHIKKEEPSSFVNPLHRITVVGDEDPWDDYNPDNEDINTSNPVSNQGKLMNNNKLIEAEKGEILEYLRK